MSNRVGKDVKGVKRPAVVGAGLMGIGIAQVFAKNGFTTTLIENDPRKLVLAKQQLRDVSIIISSEMHDLRDSDFVIEAVFENIDAKKSALRAIEKSVSSQCVISSNTSSLLIYDLSKCLKNSSRFMGVHFNNPAEFNPIVEIIGSKTTKTKHLKKMKKCLQSLGKIVISCLDTPCFILNRQSLPYLNQAAKCLDTAGCGQIDKVAVNKLGMSLGPFYVMNMVGLPIIQNASQNLKLLGKGYLPSIELLSQESSWDISRNDPSDESLDSAISNRLLGSILFPGKDILDKKLCSYSDLHTICVQALGYKKSSAELINSMPKDRLDQLIQSYLNEQALM